MKFMQIKSQKARGVLKESMWTDPEWVCEEKFDGDRRIAQFMLGGLVRFTGTRESVDGSGFVEKTENLSHLQCPKGWAVLTGTVLDGEIVAPFAKDLPGGKSKYVTAIMGSKPERAVQLQKQHGWLEYMVFDCLFYKGEDVRDQPLAKRRALASAAVQHWENKYAQIVVQTPNVKRPFFDQIVRSGGEGVILKHRSHTYGNEKLWVKVKGEWTADVVIMGFEPGAGKYKGSVGAIIFGQYRNGELVRCGTCRGFTDSLMDNFTKRPKAYIGKVVEIAHNGREPTGAFRHPRFKRFRLDKSASDCVHREDET